MPATPEHSLCSLLHWELKHHILARQLLVHACKGVQLVLGGVAVLGVQEHLGTSSPRPTHQTLLIDS